jgi:hypothetical protein
LDGFKRLFLQKCSALSEWRNSGEREIKKANSLPYFPLFEKMPTVKIKMPDKVAVQPRQPESKEQLVQKLYGNKSIGKRIHTENSAIGS